jgi:hypothetical protein
MQFFILLIGAPPHRDGDDFSYVNGSGKQGYQHLQTTKE